MAQTGPPDWGPSGMAWGLDSREMTSGGIGITSSLFSIMLPSKLCRIMVGEGILHRGDREALLLVVTEVDLLRSTHVPVRGWYQYCKSFPGSGNGWGFSSWSLSVMLCNQTVFHPQLTCAVSS